MMAYGAFCKRCGVMVAAIVDSPKLGDEIANAVSEWIRAGYTVNHLPVEEAKPLFAACKCASLPLPEPIAPPEPPGGQTRF
jgi:hypothetical protein